MSRAFRPLARVLSARARGEGPGAESARDRQEERRERERQRADGRLLGLSFVFLCAFGAVGVQMAAMAVSGPGAPRAAGEPARIVAGRADIVDRGGRILATNLRTHALYARLPLAMEPEAVAGALAGIFPDLDPGRLAADLSGERKFLWIRRTISPEQRQRVHDIGEPGLRFGPREMRLYPNGRLAAHVLGGYGFGAQGVNGAELVGTAGVEKRFDRFLSDPEERGRPLELSLDLTVQAALERVLHRGGIQLLGAKGASAVLMDVHTGEILAIASLPDFDPNDRPLPPTEGDQSDSPLFNRAVQGRYELGSTFKIFAAAQAMELGLVGPGTEVDSSVPLVWGRYRIGEWDGRDYGPTLSVADAISKSSNVVSGRLALMVGPERQRDFLAGLGLLDATPLELFEAPAARPLAPERWSEIVAITASYGHGISVSPLHLAAAYASLLNGGRKVEPTLLKRPAGAGPGERVVSERVSRTARRMLRRAVAAGTASLADVPGYAVAGKTGTANKPKRGGGYHEDRVLAAFASVFPADDPRYVLVVELDEAAETSGPKPRRTAGWTAVPVAAEIVRRVAPLLGLRPEIEPVGEDGLELARSE